MVVYVLDTFPTEPHQTLGRCLAGEWAGDLCGLGFDHVDTSGTFPDPILGIFAET